MLSLQPAKSISAAESMPALNLFPATKVESGTDKTVQVSYLQYFIMGTLNKFIHVAQQLKMNLVSADGPSTRFSNMCHL